MWLTIALVVIEELEVAASCVLLGIHFEGKLPHRALLFHQLMRWDIEISDLSRGAYCHGERVVLMIGSLLELLLLERSWLLALPCEFQVKLLCLVDDAWYEVRGEREVPLVEADLEGLDDGHGDVEFLVDSERSYVHDDYIILAAIIVELECGVALGDGGIVLLLCFFLIHDFSLVLDTITCNDQT